MTMPVSSYLWSVHVRCPWLLTASGRNDKEGWEEEKEEGSLVTLILEL
jgi:hypothetical protein